jgi:hypothetical protein
MKLVFRTTHTRSIQNPSPPSPPKPSVFFSTNSYENALETRWAFGGNMLDRVRYSGKPCGSCGGR